MTAKELAYQIEPEVRALCQNMIPAIKEAVGFVKWAAIVMSFGITWKIITSKSVLPVVIEHSIEYGIGKTALFVHPLLNAFKGFIPLLDEFIDDKTQLETIKGYIAQIESLYSTNVSQLMPSVQAALECNTTDEAKEFDFSSFGD